MQQVLIHLLKKLVFTKNKKVPFATGVSLCKEHLGKGMKAARS
jgi:hypothetical protein